MRTALMPVASLLLGVAVLLTGQGLQTTLLPVRASLEAFSTVSIGLMGGAYFFGFTLGCVKGVALVARVGHVRVFAAMTALASAAPLLHGLIMEPLLWSGFRFLTGFCFAVLYVVIESWLNERATNENRGLVFSIYTMISLSVLALGQMLLLVHDPSDLYLFALASVMVSLAVIPVVLSTSPSPQQAERVTVNVHELFRISPAGTLGSLGSGLASGAFWALAPLYIVPVTGEASHAALFMSATVIGGALFQWPIGYLSDRIGRRSTLIGSAAACAAIAIAIVTLTDVVPFAGIALLGAAWGATAFPLYPIAVANTNDFADPSDYVMVSSSLLLMYGIGAIAGPLLASLAMTAIGNTGLYAYTAFIHLLMAGYIGFRATRRESAPEQDHVDFYDALVGVHTKSQVYEEEQAHLAEGEGEAEATA